MQSVSSVLIWSGILVLILIWLPLLALIRLFDRDPTVYRTGRMFRRLGWAITRLNPNWNISIEGRTDLDIRHPYVVVSNHLSNADIPVISNLPWEMKWIGKKELFDLPVVGWMLKLAGDIPVDRSKGKNKLSVFKRSSFYLARDVSVMFFPEGTRSRRGKVNRFAPGAFDLAIREGIPLLPLVVDGTQECLPKKNWRFHPNVYVKLKVLDPIETKGMESFQTQELLTKTRLQIATQIAEWRGTSVEEVLA